MPSSFRSAGSHNRALSRLNLRTTILLLAASALFCLGAPGAHAQSYLQSIGVPGFSTQIPIPNGYIDLSNGRIHLEIPLGETYPQRAGAQYKSVMMYDSNIWSEYISGSTKYWTPLGFAGYSGWRQVDQSKGDVNSTENTVPCGSAWNKSFTNWVYYEPNGTTHSFALNHTVYMEYTSGCSVNTSAYGLATDGSGYTLYVYTTFSLSMNVFVYAPNGDMVYGPGTDHNGNMYGLDSYSYPTEVIDELGRAPVPYLVASYPSGIYPLLSTTVLNSSDPTATSTYTAAVESNAVHSNFGQSGVTEYTGGPWTISSIQLPDGTSYSFTYDSGTTAGHYGLLTSMTLPTGGTYSFTWQIFQDSTGQKYTWLASMTTPDSAPYSWTFTPGRATTCGSGQVNCKQSVEVTKPNGETTAYTFALNGGAWPIAVNYYTSYPTTIASTTQCWSFVTVSSGTCSYNVTTHSPATLVQKTVQESFMYPPSGTLTATTEYSWDSSGYEGISGSLGNLTAVKEWNFGTSVSGNPDRITNISYLTSTAYASAHVLNRPSSVTVTNGSGSTTIAKTNYCYDYASSCSISSGSFSSPGTVTNHDDTNFGTSYTTRGDLTQVQRLISGTTYLTTSAAYDTTGQVTSTTDSNGNTTTYGYSDAYDSDNGTNSLSSYGGTATNAYVTSLGLANGLSMSFQYYFGTGQMASATDFNGNTTMFSYYDAVPGVSTPTFSRPTNVWLPSTMATPGWAYEVYNLSGTPTQTGSDVYTGITTTSPTTSCGANTPPTSGTCRHDQVVLDTAGRSSTAYLMNDPDGQSGLVGLTYDSDSRVAASSAPYRSSYSPCSSSTSCVDSFTYDDLNRITSVTHADGSVASTHYGSSVATYGGQASQLCSTSYGHGYPILMVDEAGNKRQTWTDAFGRIIEADEPDSSNNLTVNTCYSYDLNNNLTGVLAAGSSQTRSYTYDALSRITYGVDPESSTTYYYYTTSGSSLCSGDPNAVCRRTDANGVTTTYSYDSVNRFLSKTYSDSTPSAYYFYDGHSPSAYCSIGTFASSNPNGNRTSMCDGAGAEAWSYDPVGNAVSVQRTTNGQTNTMSYTYNGDGSPATLTFPSGDISTYTTSNAQRQTQVADVNINVMPNVTLANASTGLYAPQGALSSLQSGPSSILSSLYYNGRGQFCQIAVNSSGTAPGYCGDPSGAGNVMDLGYSYLSGNNGNISTLTNNITSGRTQTYTYDYLNRLSTALSSATSGGDCWGQDFTYDPLGNITNVAADSSKTGCSVPTISVTVNGNNQISSSGFSYDSDGNTTNDASLTYTYDAEGRITSVDAGGTYYCYFYDGDDLRMAKATASGSSCSSPTAYELYWRDTGGNTIAETDGTGSTTNANYYEYVFFGGQRIAQSNPLSGNVYYYFADHLGSTRAVTNSSGSACYAADFLPYGTENTPDGFTDTCATNYKFTGYERDPETAAGTSNGNDYAFARYFNQRIFRFMSPDPLEGDPSDPQSLNLYTYVRNNPVNNTDPTGLDCFASDGGDCGGGEGGGCDASDPECQGLPWPTGGFLPSTGWGTGCTCPFVYPKPIPTPSVTDNPLGETNGIPDWLDLGLGGLPGLGGGCTYGAGNCGGMIYGFDEGTEEAVDSALKTASDFSAGFGDIFTFGGTYVIRKYVYCHCDDVVDKHSGAYITGGVTAVGFQTAMGATGGAVAEGKYGTLFGRGGRAAGGFFNRGLVRFGWYWDGVKDAIGLRIGPAGGFHIPFWYP